MFTSIEDYLRETKAELKSGLCKLYFDDGEWVIAITKSIGSNYKIQDRFLDLPGSIEKALRYFHQLAA